MQLHGLTILFAVPLLGAAQYGFEPNPATEDVHPPPASINPDPDESEPGSDVSEAVAGGEAATPAAPCSCDCCQVSKLLPTDFVPQQSGGAITSICAKPSVQEEYEDPTCPSQCAQDNSEGIIHAAKGELDYARWCHYSCQPLSDAEGAQCVQFPKSVIDQATSDGGNGKEVHLPPVMGVGSGMGFADAHHAAEEKKKKAGAAESDVADDKDPEKKAAEEASSSEEKEGEEPAKLKVKYDMRQLVAERLRSEAGAMVSAGASSAEQVRLNLFDTKHAAEEAAKVGVSNNKVASTLEGDVTGVESAKDTAEESERKVRKALKKGHNFAAGMMKDISDLATAAIKKAISPYVDAEAGYRATGKHLDMPDDWVKVVSARAANPYQAAVTTAVQRTDEYKRAADKLHAKAVDAQQQANFLMPHVNMMQAQGDTVGAAVEKRHAEDLVNRAHDLQAEAQGYWNKASQARATIPGWQEAAQKAAAYAAWEYKTVEKVWN